MPVNLKKNAPYDVHIDKLAFGGQGVGRINDFVIFVKRAVPGQTVRIQITKIKRKYAEAKILEVLKKSPDEVDTTCDSFGECGGCVWQNLKYEKQLEFKQQQVEETIKHVGRIRDFDMLPIIPSPKTLDYRNKIELSFGYVNMWYEKKEDGSIVYHDENPSIGFHKSGKWEEITSFDYCYLMTKRTRKLIPLIQKLIKESSYPVYNPKNHQGYWRQLVIREGKNTDELLINFVVKGLGNKPFSHNNKKKETISDKEEKVFRKELDIILKELQQITGIQGIMLTKNDGVADAVTNPCIKCIWGRDFIYDKINNLRFKISPYSFFQTNTLGAEKLYEAIKDIADLNGRDRVIDLYCGTGGISQFLADKAEHIYGFDISEHAINDARENTKANNIGNVEYIQAAIENELNTIRSIIKDCRIDTVIIDPPRAGMHKRVIKTLTELRVPKIIYVSCNPATLARDMDVLCRHGGYKVGRIQPVDMFPHTAHIETIAELLLIS